jgi:small-conductance mechanosensitive channel
MAQWQELQRKLTEWGSVLTDRATALEQEMRGLDELRAIWRATRDEAQAAGAPAAVLERVKGTLALIQQVRGKIDAHRATLLVLQDRVVKEAARCREATDQLSDYRRTAVGRLLVRDGQPIWSPERWTQSWEEMVAPARAQLAGPGLPMLAEYARLQLPRLPLQIALFVVLLLLWRRARQHTVSWLAEDSNLAPVAAVFEHPVSAALFLTLLATPWIYPQGPLIARQAVRIAATPPLLRVLDRLVDRPILPGLFALGVFFIADQIRSVLTSVALLEQLLFLIEVLAAVVVLVWLLRSGRIQRLRADLSPRVVTFLERAARLLIVLLAFAFLAGALGFMQLARFTAGAVLNSGYTALLLFAMQRFAQGVWAYVLRTGTARRMHLVQHYRSLLEQRGERALSWIATAIWIVAVLAFTELLAPARELLRAILTATLTVGSFSISLGDVLAFGISIWLSFLLSRFVRFVLAEDVYPRVQVARGLPYAFSTILHYVILLLGFLVGLSAAGMQLDRFALLAGAFGVGIGFGLQNVVNNFVSGLILLFERPLQVGDAVDIGSISGEISRIGIRASVVRTGQGAEVIVPNARLISDPVVNWTLSDRMRRIEIGVGVLYGSDPDAVIATLRSVATTHPLVVESPAPTAVFVGFGDATLNFELRAWTDRFDRWVMIRSELGVAITRAFAEAGITMRLAPPTPEPTTVAKEQRTHGEETPS